MVRGSLLPVRLGQHVDEEALERAFAPLRCRTGKTQSSTRHDPSVSIGGSKEGNASSVGGLSDRRGHDGVIGMSSLV
jgi:hypothetical protein